MNSWRTILSWEVEMPVAKMSMYFPREEDYHQFLADYAEEPGLILFQHGQFQGLDEKERYRPYWEVTVDTNKIQ